MITHSRHLCRKCRNAGSSVRTICASVLEPGLRFRPLELVTVLGEPFESVIQNHVKLRINTEVKENKDFIMFPLYV